MIGMKLSGNRVRAARDAKGMSRSEVARLAHTSIDTIKRAEAGTNDPAASTLARIAQALDVPVGDLFVEDEVVA